MFDSELKSTGEFQNASQDEKEPEAPVNEANAPAEKPDVSLEADKILGDITRGRKTSFDEEGASKVKGDKKNAAEKEPEEEPEEESKEDKKSKAIEKKPKELDFSYTQNRELSWLQFDRRVLEEALDPNVPLLEAMKFISIFGTNLDEFFMVRVGSLIDLSIIAPDLTDNKTNMTPTEQLDAIYAAVRPLVKERDDIYHRVTGKLKKYGFKELDLASLSKSERKFAKDFYREFIRPVLSPQVVDERHPFPHLRNKELYVVAILAEDDGSKHLGIVPVPDNVPDILFDPENPLHFVRTEKIIAFFINKIFDIYTTSNPTVISVTRNADISFDEEKFSDDEGDYRLHVSRLLKKRNRLNAVRLEVEGEADKELINGLSKRLKLTKDQVYTYDSPINLGWVFGLDRRVSPEQRAELSYPNFVPRMSNEFDMRRSIMQQVEERDRLLFYPYDSIEPFLRMLQEAAVDPDVISIKITVYRLASESRVAAALAEAAENGKEVMVLMELRARFDEANNIGWSDRLEEAGCTIIYGMENYKCHSKVCLITKRGPEGVTYITQIGTGNYNEKTARLYTDLSLITADPTIGRDAVAFFQNMQIGNLKGDYEELLVAPKYIKRTIMRLIDREITKGEDGRITMKANALTDRDIIDKLVEASQAGVQVRMNLRGICCMLPGIEGKTDNIHVRSIVGQFLEHSRIFVFGDGDDMEMYIGSADLMTRNLVHRVEVAVPIKEERTREAILLFLDKIFEDNVKARKLSSDGTFVKLSSPKDPDRFCLHDWCIETPLQETERIAPESFVVGDTFVIAEEPDLGNVPVRKSKKDKKGKKGKKNKGVEAVAASAVEAQFVAEQYTPDEAKAEPAPTAEEELMEELQDRGNPSIDPANNTPKTDAEIPASAAEAAFVAEQYTADEVKAGPAPTAEEELMEELEDRGHPTINPESEKPAAEKPAETPASAVEAEFVAEQYQADEVSDAPAPTAEEELLEELEDRGHPTINPEGEKPAAEKPEETPASAVEAEFVTEQYQADEHPATVTTADEELMEELEDRGHPTIEPEGEKPAAEKPEETPASAVEAEFVAEQYQADEHPATVTTAEVELLEELEEKGHPVLNTDDKPSTEAEVAELEQKVAQTPASEPDHEDLSDERDFMKDWPHTTASEGTEEQKAEEPKPAEKPEEPKPEKKKGFFARLFG